jgi:hypothetical protein
MMCNIKNKSKYLNFIRSSKNELRRGKKLKQQQNNLMYPLP